MEKLFVYGTLKDPDTQLEAFGRIAKSEPDKLTGYRKSTVVIGRETYPIILPERGKLINGLVLSVTKKELAKIDKFETDAYSRIKVILKSGKKTWVYVKPQT